jgi:CheY-like chemotaxis protein
MARILLIEPDTLLADVYGRTLLHVGYQVSHVTSGQAAIDDVDEHAPDLIILELQLPAHSGLEFLYEFRSYPEWQDIPVIVNTNLPPQSIVGDELLYEELGIRMWHYKPQATLQLLVRSVTEQLLLQQSAEGRQ